MRSKIAIVAAALLSLPAALLWAQGVPESGDPHPPFLPTPPVTVSTVPANGDVNPYGVAFVPAGFPKGGTLAPGDILVSNFNNKANQQGTGTTIVDAPASGGAPTVFFQGTAPLGLTTALAALREGLVVVGNLPTSDGTCATAQAGSLLVINSSGQLLATLTESDINGPWDMAVFEQGRGRLLLFVANALSGTVTRLDARVVPGGLTILSHTQIASGYMHRCDPVALVVGPTGLVYDPAKDVLYVASTDDNKVFAIPHAAETGHDGGTGHVIYEDNTHLHGPLALALAPNGDLLAANSDVINADANQPSEIVEFTVEGRFVKQLSVDPAQGGSFGLAVASGRGGARLAYVDDNTATLTVWNLP
jgi:DNA-binding beta-propeller fold protein YncE